MSNANHDKHKTTPIAISAMSSDDMEKMGITDFNGVAQASPSIHFTTYPSSNRLTLYMRGQGINDPMQVTSDGSVGLYQDGFYVGRPLGAIFELADLERVEVPRGPQGTLSGRNTTGGAVNLIGKKPTGEFGFKQSFSFGSRNLFRSRTVIDLPEWQNISTKLTLLKSSQDGYVKNSGSSHDDGESGQFSSRFALNWKALDNLSVDYFMEKGDLDNTPGYLQNASLKTVAGYTHADSPRGSTYRPIDLRSSRSSFENHGLTLTWDVSDALTIKSLSGSGVPDQVSVTVPSCGLLNGRLTWAVDLPRGDRARIGLWGENLTNQRYPLQVVGLGGGAVATNTAPAGRTALADIWAPPPSYGIDMVYEY